eukprot:TRINITY_DN58396_c0_g1_i1.p2 TRINITY_DN58396_c0_g1~~TRINITY_DN58396_c0_g1_i1.p2  ORF type:complete len:185 (+),score=32.82 TRINITY_DN58396_c0_g1_i1:56-610(+)
MNSEEASSGNYVVVSGDQSDSSVSRTEFVSLLVFVAGVLMLLSSLWELVAIFDALSSPLSYLLNIYECMFAFTLCVLDAPAVWVRKSKHIPTARRNVHAFAKFLTTSGGKGATLLFLGLLQVSLHYSGPVSISIGLYVLVLGVYHVALQYDAAPEMPCIPSADTAATLLPGDLSGGSEDYIRVV